MPMPKIELIRLRCTDPAAQRRFYCEAFGMTAFDDLTLGYPGEDARILFERAERPYAPSRRDVYWKVALSVPDLDLAYRQLTAQGVEVSAPRQVGTVAYLAHATDPEGFTVELLDHAFEGQRADAPIDSNRLGGGAHLNLLTLRTTDIESVKARCTAWGMQLLAVAPVPAGAFTLYFFGPPDATLPTTDVTAVDNLTWIYQRPYTVLEVQRPDGAPELSLPPPGQGGYAGAVVSDVDDSLPDETLRITADRPVPGRFLPRKS
ncbi:MAG: VOC family protein [Myxococcota bacterium]